METVIRDEHIAERQVEQVFEVAPIPWPRGEDALHRADEEQQECPNAMGDVGRVDGEAAMAARTTALASSSR